MIAEETLQRIEREFPEGIPSQKIVSVLEGHGVKFSEATLRKWVQLELLPRSFRVGHEGKQKGSQGLYPITILRQIVEIKELLEHYTIEEIRREYLLLRGEVETLERSLRGIFEGIERALGARPEDTNAELVRRDLKTARTASQELVRRLRDIETRLALRARLARAAM